jgi:hypothetical protein
MLFHASLKVLATASTLLLTSSSSTVHAAPLNSLQARDAFSVTVNPGFASTDQKVVYPLTNLAPVTAAATGYGESSVSMASESVLMCCISQTKYTSFQ